MNKDQITGRVKAVEGLVKEVAGKLLGNLNLQARGRIAKTMGQLQADHGDLLASLNKPI
jgi:uncharacterized protein YjbJ (UPF0337 family)